MEAFIIFMPRLVCVDSSQTVLEHHGTLSFTSVIIDSMQLNHTIKSTTDPSHYIASQLEQKWLPGIKPMQPLTLS
jgi:hypothetical protein